MHVIIRRDAKRSSSDAQVRYCDEDAALLREAEAGFLSFSVFKSDLGYLRGKPCGLNRGGAPRIRGSRGLAYSPRARAAFEFAPPRAGGTGRK